jgi:hypothetical protein
MNLTVAYPLFLFLMLPPFLSDDLVGPFDRH